MTRLYRLLGVLVTRCRAVLTPGGAIVTLGKALLTPWGAIVTRGRAVLTPGGVGAVLARMGA